MPSPPPVWEEVKIGVTCIGVGVRGWGYLYWGGCVGLGLPVLGWVCGVGVTCIGVGVWGWGYLYWNGV